MQLFIDYLEILKNVLSFITFLLKRNYSDLIIQNIDSIMQIQIKILKNIPPSNFTIRKDILHMITFNITETINFEKVDKS